MNVKAAAHRARCDAPRPLRSRLRQLLRLPMHTAAIFLRKNCATRAMRFQRPIALTRLRTQNATVVIASEKKCVLRFLRRSKKFSTLS